MKIIKKITVMQTAALLAASVFAFSACAFGKTDPGRFLSKEKLESEFSSGAMIPLTMLSDYDVLSVDSFGIANIQKDGNYSLYDLTTNSFITSAPVSDSLYQISDGLYYSESNQNGETKYTLYYKTGSTAYVDGYVAKDFFTTKDGVRIYINTKGELTEEKNPLASILTCEAAAYTSKTENYYLKIASDFSAFYVFEESGKFKTAVDTLTAFPVGADDKIQAFWAVNDTLFLQTTRVLSDDNRSYDIFFDGEKLDLKTYSYNLKDGKEKELIAFDFMVTELFGTYENYAVLRGYDIEDRECDSMFLQAFGEDGNVYIDLQKLLPGTIDFGMEGCYVYLRNSAETAVYYDGNKKYAGPVYSNMTGYVKGRGYYAYGDNLHLYDNSGEPALTVTDYNRYGATPDGKIYYVQETKESYGTGYTLYIYDGNVNGKKKSDKEEISAEPVKIGQTGATFGKIDNGFYIESDGGSDKVYALFGKTPQLPVLTDADKNSVSVNICTVNETDYALIRYTKSGATRYSVLTMTNSYTK